MSAMAAGASVAATVEETVDEHPWIERLARVGWWAKAAVYVTMGVVALLIAFGKRTEAASPEGALDTVSHNPFRRPVLALFAIGLAAYFAWRLVSVLVIRGSTLKDHLQRVGYLFSGLFYGSLALTAGAAALRGRDVQESYVIERLARSLMDTGWGRMVIVLLGAVTMGVGVYFVAKAVRRDFVDNLRGVHCDFRSNTTPMCRLLWVLGLVGWLGRGLVTAAVGYYVFVSGWTYRPGDARGFDRTLRHLAGSPAGSAFVVFLAGMLVVYGIYCAVSAPRRALKDSPT